MPIGSKWRAISLAKCMPILAVVKYTGRFFINFLDNPIGTAGKSRFKPQIIEISFLLTNNIFGIKREWFVVIRC